MEASGMGSGEGGRREGEGSDEEGEMDRRGDEVGGRQVIVGFSALTAKARRLNDILQSMIRDG